MAKGNMLSFACFVIAYAIFVASVPISQVVPRWIKVSNDELPRRGLEVVGMENGKYLYLAQAVHYNQSLNVVYNVTGKLVIDHDIIASIAVWGLDRHFLEFMILDAPHGALSWVPVSNSSSLPENLVVGGDYNNGMETYVCRVSHLGQHVIPGYFSSSGACHYGFGGIELVTLENYEALIVNSLGAMWAT